MTGNILIKPWSTHSQASANTCRNTATRFREDGRTHFDSASAQCTRPRPQSRQTHSLDRRPSSGDHDHDAPRRPSNAPDTSAGGGLHACLAGKGVSPSASGVCAVGRVSGLFDARGHLKLSGTGPEDGRRVEGRRCAGRFGWVGALTGGVDDGWVHGTSSSMPAHFNACTLQRLHASTLV